MNSWLPKHIKDFVSTFKKPEPSQKNIRDLEENKDINFDADLQRRSVQIASGPKDLVLTFVQQGMLINYLKKEGKYSPIQEYKLSWNEIQILPHGHFNIHTNYPDNEIPKFGLKWNFDL